MASPNPSTTILYDFIILEPSGKCLYYQDFSTAKKDATPGALQSSASSEPGSEPSEVKDKEFTHRLQNIFGITDALKSLVKQLSPTPIVTFRNLVTNKFKLSIFETPGGMRFILFTSVDDIDYLEFLRKIYREAFVDYVQKNPLYTAGNEIDCPLFIEKLRELVSTKFAQL